MFPEGQSLPYLPCYRGVFERDPRMGGHLWMMIFRISIPGTQLLEMWFGMFFFSGPGTECLAEIAIPSWDSDSDIDSDLKSGEDLCIR